MGTGLGWRLSIVIEIFIHETGILDYFCTFGLHLNVSWCQTQILNAPVRGKTYIHRPNGFKISGRQKFAYQLERALDRLKQAPGQ